MSRFFRGGFVLLVVQLAVLVTPVAAFRNTIQDFRPDVVDFRAEGLPGAFRDGVLVQPDPGDLKVGDVFLDVDGVARKVSRVQWADGDLYIDTVKPRFDEVYVYAEIPRQTVPLGRAVTNIEFEKELYAKGASSIAVKAGAEVTSDLTVGFKSPTLIQVRIQGWKFWEWTIGFQPEPGYVEANLDYELALTGALNCSVTSSVETKPVTLYGLSAPSIPGLEANVGLLGKAVLEGSVSAELPFTFGVTGDAAFRCTLEGQTPLMIPTDASGSGSLAYSLSLDPALTAEASLKLLCYLGGSVTLAGLEIADFEAGGGPYLKLDGTLEGSIGYDSVEGLTGPSWTASASSEIGFCTEVSGSLCDDKWKVSVFSQEYPIYKLFEVTTEEEDS